MARTLFTEVGRGGGLNSIFFLKICRVPNSPLAVVYIFALSKMPYGPSVFSHRTFEGGMPRTCAGGSSQNFPSCKVESSIEDKDLSADDVEGLSSDGNVAVDEGRSFPTDVI